MVVRYEKYVDAYKDDDGVYRIGPRPFDGYVKLVTQKIPAEPEPISGWVMILLMWGLGLVLMLLSN